MDGNNQPNNGIFSHILDPHLGQVLHGLVRTLLPQHDHHTEGAEPASATSSQTTEIADMQPLQPTVPIRPQGEETDMTFSPGTNETHASQSSSVPPFTSEQGASAVTTSTPSYRPPQEAADFLLAAGDIHDVEMASPVEDHPAGSFADASASGPQLPSANSRRARVDEEDEDDGRESNRQRMHAPTFHDEATHHFMPIPVEHAVPQAASAANHAPQPRADARYNPPSDGSQRVMWRFDFLPAPAPAAHPDNPNHVHGQTAEGAHHAPAHQHPDANRPQLPTLNVIFNLAGGEPHPGHGGAPTDPAAANTTGNAPPPYVFPPYLYPIYAEGGNVPGNPGFAFPTFPFPFGAFGIDMMEERDDPERAQRLVDGVEEVPVGLVKRMERVGGPGSVQGEAPTCAVCWESLLEPEGGGFEGNAELARAEADQAAREDAASQQQRETSISLDSPTSASQGASSSSTSEASASTTPSTALGEEKYPKIVVLPCSHVFHASCLLPWFSKPGRTTCPSCRFDIDPDSLTYKPRPLRARRAPSTPPAGADAVPQGPSAFGAPPQVYIPVHPGFPPAPALHAAAQGTPDIPFVAPGAAAGVQTQGDGSVEQPGHQHPPLPPFITFDISMIIPIFPGRPAAGRPAGAASPAPGGQATNNAAEANPQGPAPQPPRTDRNGFRLDDPLLTEAVRTTFERIFGRPAPNSRAQPRPQQAAAGGPAPADGANAPPRDPPMDWFTFAGPLPGFPPMPPPGYEGPSASAERPAPKRKWTLPSAPGPTLRQLVERNEREMGLRCSDVSCGLGPSDEDPISTFDATALRQVSIRPLKDDGSGKQAVCEHRFHPSCLVSAERVAGWGGEDKKEERENDGGEDVEVSCPVCRAVGVISRLDWDEGACALA